MLPGVPGTRGRVGGERFSQSRKGRAGGWVGGGARSRRPRPLGAGKRVRTSLRDAAGEALTFRCTDAAATVPGWSGDAAPLRTPGGGEPGAG